jgi:hypothetical protein
VHRPTSRLTIAALIASVVATCARRPMRVVIAAMLLTAAALVYVVAYFAIDTDSARLIDDNVPWRQREKAFDAAFPHRTDLIAIVVDGGTPEIAEQATARLAQRLLSDASRYRAVWRPDGGPFFDRVGLLFESTESVAVTMQRLVAAQPLLGTLAADPSVRDGVGRDRRG